MFLQLPADTGNMVDLIAQSEQRQRDKVQERIAVTGEKDHAINTRRDKREQRLYWLTVISVGISIASLFTAGISVYVTVTVLRITSLQ